MRGFQTYIVLLALALGSVAHGQTEPSPVRIGVYQNEPKIFLDSSGKPSGLFIDLAEALADEHGWEIEYVVCDWTACLEMIESGELDLMPDVAYSKARDERFDFHDEPVIESFSRVYSDPSHRIERLTDLEGLKVATLENSAQEQEILDRSRGFDVSVELVLADSFEEAFAMVGDGLADAAISNEFFGDRHASEWDLRPTPVVILPTNLFFATRQGEHGELLAQIDDSLNRWKRLADSPYYAELAQWTAHEPRPMMPRWLYVLLLIGAGAVGAAVVAIFWLRRVVNRRTAHLQTSNEEIRKKEYRLRMIVEHSPDVFIHVDSEEGRILFANPALTAVLGWDPEDVIGAPAIKFIPKSVLALIRHTASSLATEPEVFGVAVQHQDGTMIPVEARIGVLPGESESDRVIFQCILRDLSERENAARALAESEYRARRIMQGLPIPTHVWRSTEDGFELESINDAATSDTGFIDDIRIGGSLDEIFGDDSVLAALVRDSFESKGRIRKQVEVEKESRHTVVVTVGYLKPDSVIAHFEDVTEQAQLEQRLATAQRLETAGMLAGGIAHDFNNLLTVINNSAELALLDVDRDSPMTEDLEAIVDAGKKAADVTRQLLMFSRSEMVEPTVFELSDSVQEITRMLRRFVEESIEIETDLCDENDKIFADTTQIEQVIMNLALNARDAITGSGRITLRTAVDPDAELVMLTVEDTGSGMTPETRERAFDPFFTTKEVGKGTGLGLATAYSVMKQSGGSIMLDSEPGEGTRVTLAFPLSDVVEKAQSPGELSLSSPGAGQTILLVEDEESVRRVTARLLEMSGFEVITACNAEEAEQKYSEIDTFDLLLTDVVMPGISGKALADRLTAIDPDLLILFMSGYTDSQLDPHGVMPGGLNVLSKPFTRHELVEKVTSILREQLASHR